MRSISTTCTAPRLDRPTQRSRRLRSMISCLAVALGCLAGSAASARAATFTPRHPGFCGGENAAVPNWTMSSTEFPENPNAAGTYINNIEARRYLWANQHVSRVNFNLASFSTEATFDRLEMFPTISGGTFLSLSGAQSGWKTVTVAANQSLQTSPIDVRFVTDVSVTRPGFNINAVTACSNGTSAASSGIRGRVGQKELGMLLAKDDVVYIGFPAPPTTQRVNLTLNGPAGTDFDVYVRCNALPTPTAFYQRAFSADSKEFLSFVPEAACSSTSIGTYWVAINSFGGAGRFDLRWSTANAADIRTIKVGVDFPATPEQLQLFADMWKKGVREFYGHTEGQFLFNRVEIFPNATGTPPTCDGELCKAVMNQNAGRCTAAFGPILLKPSCWSRYRTYAHEMLHKFLPLIDEYRLNADQTASYAECGHSVLASTTSSNHNLCTGANHGRDRDPRAPPSAEEDTTAAWPKLSGLLPTIMTTTPENYDYQDHDFNNAITVVIR